MRLHRPAASLVIALASVLAPTLVLTSPSAPVVRTEATSTVADLGPADRVSVFLLGDVRRSQVLSTQKIASLPQHEVVVTFSTGGVPRTRTYTGPLLLDVVNGAKPRFDSTRSNDQLAFAIRVGATDGYRAVVAYGEIDPNFANTQVLLALTEDGVALDRPRLVVPGDARGGRYVSDVRTIEVVDLGR